LNNALKQKWGGTIGPTRTDNALVQRQSGTSPFGAPFRRALILHFKNRPIQAIARTSELLSLVSRLLSAHIATSRPVSAAIMPGAALREIERLLRHQASDWQ
jgi:hypothetical protein